MDYFANSFLIEMSRNQIRADKKVLYAKMSTDRDRHFSIATTIEEQNGEKVVVKQPMTNEAKRHLQNMQNKQKDYGSWSSLVVTPFLQEKSLGQQAKQAIYEHNVEKVKNLISTVSMLCEKESAATGNRHIVSREMSGRERTEFAQVFGTSQICPELPCIAPANIDLILDNIFEKDGKYRVIDCEWIFDFPVPVAFIIWRAINELYSSYPQLEQDCRMLELLEEYQITQEMSETFHKWGTYFAEHYVGANRVLHYSIPEIGISLEEFRKRHQEKDLLNCQLFVDTGNGFREEEKIQAETVLQDGAFRVTFDLKNFKDWKALRFDPLEGKPCICRIDHAGTNAKLKAVNASGKVEHGDLFLTTDPVYLVKMEENKDQVKISGMIAVLSMEEALERANWLLGKKNGLAFWRK